MSDKEQPQSIDPAYVPPEFEPKTEREQEALSRGFSRGYREGTHDIVFAIARHHHWALKKVDKEKAKHIAEVKQTAADAVAKT